MVPEQVGRLPGIVVSRLLPVLSLVFLLSVLLLVPAAETRADAQEGTPATTGNDSARVFLGLLLPERTASRPNNYLARKELLVYVDGTFLGLVQNHGHLVANVPPGRHLLWIRGKALKRTVASRFFDFESGETYPLGGLRFDGMASFPLVRLTDSQHQVLMARTNPVIVSPRIRARWSRGAQKAYEKFNMATLAVEFYGRGLELQNRAREAVAAGDRAIVISCSEQAAEAFAKAADFYHRLYRKVTWKLWKQAIGSALVAAGASYQAHQNAQYNARINSLAKGGGPATGYGTAVYYVPDLDAGVEAQVKLELATEDALEMSRTNAERAECARSKPLEDCFEPQEDDPNPFRHDDSLLEKLLREELEK